MVIVWLVIVIGTLVTIYNTYTGSKFRERLGDKSPQSLMLRGIVLVHYYTERE